MANTSTLWSLRRSARNAQRALRSRRHFLQLIAMAEGRDLQGNEHLDHRLALEPLVNACPTPEQRHLDRRRSDDFDFDVCGGPSQPRIQRRAGSRRMTVILCLSWSRVHDAGRDTHRRSSIARRGSV